MPCICFKEQIFVNKGKFRMKCVEKYDTSAKRSSRKFLDMPIDLRNLLWYINFLKFPWLFLNFPDFQQNSKFPWQIFKFPDFSLTLNFPDFSLTSGNPEYEYKVMQVFQIREVKTHNASAKRTSQSLKWKDFDVNIQIRIQVVLGTCISYVTFWWKHLYWLFRVTHFYNYIPKCDFLRIIYWWVNEWLKWNFFSTIKKWKTFID